MGNWSVIVPEATTNLITNPSIEDATTGWVAVGSALTRSTTYAAFGAASLQSVTDNAANNEGAYFSVNPGVNSVGMIGSAYVRNPSGGGGTLRLRIRDQTNGVEVSSASIVLTTNWQRLSAIVNLGGVNCADLRLYIETTVQGGITILIDGAQIEQKASTLFLTTYCDGDQPGCLWTRTRHASTSTRTAQFRGGGRLIDIEASHNIKVSFMTGFGTLPLTHNINETALLPGAQFQSSKAQPRTLTLTFTFVGSSLANYHAKRDYLIELFRPDKVLPEQPVVLRYNGAGPELDLNCHYIGGLEGQANPGRFERVAARFIAYDPFFYQADNGVASLSSTQTVTNLDRIARRIDGNWQALGTGCNGTVHAMAIADNGDVYVGGEFASAGGVANTSRIARWDGTAWNALGTGCDSTVYAIAIAANGDVYAGGVFTAAGGVANTDGIARWDGSAWNALGTGIDGATTVYAIAFAPNGDVYAGGTFATMGGVANTSRIAVWAGGTWSALGTGLNSDCRAIVIAPDNTLYAAGAFTTAGGGAANRVAKWDITAATWSAMAAGFGQTGLKLALRDDGLLYAGGVYPIIGTTSVASWNGSAWTEITTGGARNCEALLIGENGLLYAGTYVPNYNAAATTADWAVYNGAVWAKPELDLPSAHTARAIAMKNGKLYVGWSGTTTSHSAAALTTVTCDSSAQSMPIFTIKRSGGSDAVLAYISNISTGKRLWLNQRMQDGEELTLDLRQGKKTLRSRTRGLLMTGILGLSELASFGLVPGTNSIAFYVYRNGGTITSYVNWPITHWSVDGAA